MVKIRNKINDIEPYVPGRSIKEIADAYGLKEDEIIKLGSNENPLGPSPAAVEAMERELESVHRYPESALTDLREAIADYAGVGMDQVIVGGDGADEIIDVLGRTFLEPGESFVVPMPSYMYYEYTLQAHDARAVHARWDVNENRLDLESVLDAVDESTRLVFLCTPNNPTGGLIDKKEIRAVLESTDALVVVDEAYTEFAGVDNTDLLPDHENLFILRTFSKVMGLAGMRIGYGLGDPQIIEYMHRVKPVFSLTRLSHAAALATIRDRDYIKKSTEYSIKSREYLYSGLKKFPELRVFRSYANYILIDVRGTGRTAAELSEELLRKGIIVRDCTSFAGLDEYWIRVSVGTLEEDRKFLEVLGELVQ